MQLLFAYKQMRRSSTENAELIIKISCEKDKKCRDKITNLRIHHFRLNLYVVHVSRKTGLIILNIYII